MLKLLNRLPSLGVKSSFWLSRDLICIEGLGRRRFSYYPNFVSQVLNIRRVSIKTIPNQVVNFFKNESKYLAETLTEDTKGQFGFMQEYQFDPKIKQTLDESLDVYNKFVKLLSFNPIDIPASLYLDFIHNTEVLIDDATRPHLVRRLSFHKNFDYIWKSLINETSTINDIEEVVVLIGDTLKENNNLEVGFLEASLSVEECVHNQSLRSIIYDSFAFNFNIPKTHLLESLEDLDQLDFNSTVSHNDKFKWLIVSRNRVNKSSMVPSYCPESPSQMTLKFLKLPGWFAFIFKQHPDAASDNLKMVYILDNFKKLGLNDYDFERIIDLGFLELESIYKIFQEAYKAPPNGISWSLDLILLKALYKKETALLKKMLCEKHMLISNKTLTVSLCKLYDLKSSYLLETLEVMLSSKVGRNYSKVYEAFLEGLNFSHHCSITFHKILLQTKNSERFYLNLRNRLPICGDDKDSIIQLYKNFLKKEAIPTKALLELLRLLIVRNRIFQEDVIQSIVGSLLLRLTEVNSSGTRVIRYKQEVKFHNCIRAACQSISDLENEEISLVLSKLCQFFNDLDALFGSIKDYLTRYFIYETFNFLERKLPIERLKTIAEDISMPGGLRTSILFLYRVKKNPEDALNILKEFKDHKSQLNRNLMNAIESGILTSKTLTAQQRLELFQRFRKDLELHGYKSKMLRRNSILLIKLMLSMSSSNESKLNLLDKARSFTKKQKIPQHMINKWSTEAKRI